MVQRITGLASGMDIDSMVKQLMTAERVPLDKLKQQKQTLEWQRDDYRSMNSLLLDFRTTLTNMKLSSQYRIRNTTTSDNSLVTATATSSASTTSTSIKNVTQLASAATKVNNGPISKSGQTIDVTKSFISQDGNLLTGISWATGIVNSKPINVTNDTTQTVQLGLDASTNETFKMDASAMNVTVNGNSYSIITTMPSNGTVGIGSNQVYVNSTTGDLTFSTPLQKDSTVKVDYVTNSKHESTTLAKDSTVWQLSKGAINTVTLTFNNTSYSVGGTINPNDPTNTNKYLVDSAGGSIGQIDIQTGKITFNTPMAGDTSVSINYTQNYTSFGLQTFTSTSQKSQNFVVTSADTINGVINNVNASKVGVNMYYDSFKDKLTLTRTETGNFNGLSLNSTDVQGNKVTTSATNQEILTSGNFIDSVLNFSGANETGGENAVLNINGLDTERNTNTFNINGVTYTLKSTFTNPVNVTVNNDTDKIFDNIKSFIDKYNTLIDAVSKKTSEERYRDYPPLTDDQKEQLTDTQQQQWQDKAKSGLLKGDSILNSTLSQMRLSFYQPVENSSVNNAYKQLASIGITTSVDYLQGGKLEIDEAKLKQAIQDDPDSVENLFNGTGTDSSSQGIVYRLYDNVSATINQLNDRAGKSYSTNQQFTIGKSLDSVNNQINSFNSRLTQIEDRYYTQFTAMEQAIQQSNSQMSYISQMFGSGN